LIKITHLSSLLYTVKHYWSDRFSELYQLIENISFYQPNIKYIKFLILYSLLLSPLNTNANTTAKALFSELNEMVYQVRVIDLASGDKYSIGSGFLINKDGHITTNFHVVSSYVHEPEKYKLEIIKHDGKSIPATVFNIDLIHDLAILRSDETDLQYFQLSKEFLQQGNRVYSMGNPHDLGMTIIEGNYNGLIEKSRYKKILFSGSLNPGMSGGPAFNSKGEVIGVNVSKGGEQLSFLVPVSHLKNLLTTPSKSLNTNFHEQITRSLHTDQESFYQTILNTPFKMEPLGELMVPTKFSSSFKCWGHTVDDEDIKYEAAHQHCKSQDEIYVNDKLTVGDFFYQYEWITTNHLNRFQFYTVLETRFSQKQFNNTYEEEYVSEYLCETEFVTFNKRSWKVATCFRAYKQHPNLYDAQLLMASVDHNKKAAIIKVGATGISSKNALDIFKNIMENTQWER